MSSTQHPSITLIQRVPSAASFERGIRVWDTDGIFQRQLAPDFLTADLALHLRGNMSVSADAVLVDGPTLRAILEEALDMQRYVHSRTCGVMASAANPCTCWRRDAKRMLESLKEATG